MMLVCSKCKGSNIQTLAWVDANTNVFKGEYQSEDSDNNWCNFCESHVNIEEFDFNTLNANPDGKP